MTRSQERHVLVIGGCGYIGSVLVGRLLEQGCRVRVLDALLYSNGDVAADWIERPDFGLMAGDMCDADVLHAALEGVTDVVLLAALVGDPICKAYPDEARRVNELGAQLVFDALHGRGIDRFVFFSTCSNYGLRADGEAALETSALNPQSLYAETKVATEGHVLARADQADFHATVLRVATAYGLSRRMRFDLTVSEFTRELALKRTLLVYDENTWRPYCHVQDVVKAVITVLQAKPDLVRGEVFNVGGNAENYTKQRIVDIVLGQLPGGDIEYKAGGGDPRDYKVSFDKIETQLGFRPDHNVAKGVRNLIAALKAGLFADADARKRFYGNCAIGGAHS